VDHYKNILWHEIAHLFGAYEHYREDDYKATSECEDPDSCIMQRNPGRKLCEFCGQSKREMHRYFCERRPQHHCRS